MRWTAMVLLLVLIAPAVCGGTIRIDGDFSDWKDVAPVSLGPISTESSGQSGDGNALRGLWMTRDQNCLYLSIECSAPVKGSAWGPTFVALDTDLDKSTGYPCGPLGVDWLVQPARELNGSIMFFRRTEGANDSQWSRWLAPTVQQGSYAIGHDGQNNRIEMRIPFQEIGVADPQAAALRFRISDGSDLLDPARGSWMPRLAAACFSLGKDPERTARTNSDGDHGDLELLETIPKRAQVRLARLWCEKPCARVGDSIRFSAWIESTGDEDARDISVELKAAEGVKTGQVTARFSKLPVGSYERVDWQLAAEKAASVPLEVMATYKRVASDSAVKTERALYRLLVIDRSASFSRQELMTDQNGYWRVLDRPTTLQEGNSAPLVPVQHKRSSEIRHSPYGICAHLPRAKDYEDPFNASHLVDGDPATCWSSQQNSSPYPGSPPWARIDLGRAVTIRQVNLIPYWRNTDFPLGFRVFTSNEGKNWETALVVKQHRFNAEGPLRGDKRAQQFPLAAPVTARFVRIDFERLPLAGGNYAEVSQGYKARLSEIELVDDKGGNAALGATVAVSDCFTGWHNTAKTVEESFPKVMDLGVKFIRIGQWGDQTEWAAVEREKGRFEVDPVTDAAIRRATESGVDLLYTLDYGNALYNTAGDGGPVSDIGPIFREGHPFCGNYGPRTEAQREAFLRYVDFVVGRYKDRVKYWELWNEENGWYPGFEPELYGKLLTAVARRIKQIDPKLYVVYGGTAAPAPITTEISLREGGAPYVDAYAFHPYGIDKPEGGMGTMEMHQGKNLGQSREQTGWNRLEEIIAGVKKPFAQHGRPDIDVWLNEWGTNVSGLGFTYNPGMGEYGCTKYFMRYYLYSGWLNARTAWWALYNVNMSQDWGILDQHDYGFRPMAYALQNICSVVSDVEPIRKLDYSYAGRATDPKVIGYTRDGRQETLVLVWAADLVTDELRAYPSKLSFALANRPGRVTLTDLYWGVSQPAVWSYDRGRVVVDHLVVRDYPLVVSCERVFP